MLPHPLTNFEIQKSIITMNLNFMVFIPEIIYQKIKDGAYVINLDAYSDIGTHWIALYVLNNYVTYLEDSFAVNIFQKKLKHLLVIKT